MMLKYCVDRVIFFLMGFNRVAGYAVGGPHPISGSRLHSGALAIWAEKRLACQGSGRPHETRLATLDVSWWTKPATAASPHLDSVKVDIVQHLIEPRNVDRRQLVPALPLRTCRV